MAVISVTEKNFENEVLNSEKPVLADFYADWCGPCKMLSPVVHEIAEERGDIKVVSVNVDDEPDLAEKYEVYSIPCLVVIKNGEETGRHTGFIPKDAINALVGGK
jgi:thioredoxin 1